MKEKGQSLVEMALMLPILLIMFVGVFEVGYAIRNQLILNTVSREGARFASKSVNMNLNNEVEAQKSYDVVVEHMYDALADTLPNDFDGLVITNIVVQSGFPCEDVENCNCETAIYHPYTSTLILTPEINGYEFYKYTKNAESKINVAELSQEMLLYNNKINCNYQLTGGEEPSLTNHMIMVEIYYSHHQLIGFPGLNLIDPIPLYSKAIFRKNVDRSN